MTGSGGIKSHWRPSIVLWWGLWDRGRLERVVQNLLGNAIKYSPLGGEVNIKLWRELDETAQWAVVSVRDSGVGIPAAELPHLFEHFYRATNVSGRIAGTGIGLATARRVVEQQAGRIEVEGEEGQGSTFTVRLPLGPTKDLQPTMSRPTQEDALPESSTTPGVPAPGLAWEPGAV